MSLELVEEPGVLSKGITVEERSDSLLNTADAAKLLKMNKGTLSNWICQKKHGLRRVKIGGKLFLSKKQLDQIIADAIKGSDSLLNVSDAAKLLKVSKQTLCNWISQKKYGLCRVKIGGKLFVTKKQIDRIIEDAIKASEVSV